MKKWQLVNIIIISTLLFFSASELMAVGFLQMMITIIEGVRGGFFWLGFPVLVVAIVMIVYLISAIKFYLRKTESNGLIFWACWINILAMILAMIVIFSGLIFGIISGIIIPIPTTKVFSWVSLILLSPALPVVFMTASYILFIVGKKKSLNLTNIN